MLRLVFFKQSKRCYNDTIVIRRLYVTSICCSTREEDEAVRRVYEDSPFRSANQIRAAANFPGTSRTVINRLRDANNILYRRTSSKEGLTDRQTVDHLVFTTGWRDFDWGSVIFADETSISSDYESHEKRLSLARH